MGLLIGLYHFFICYIMIKTVVLSDDFKTQDIEIYEEKTAVTAGPKLFILDRDFKPQEIPLPLEKDNIWIRAIKFISKNDLILLTYFNKILQINLQNNDIIEFQQTPSCILYSGRIEPYNNSLLLAAGTVFNSIILSQFNQKQNELISSLTLTEHSGAIFDLLFINTTSNPALLSCSDDRSLRYWSLHFENGKLSSAIPKWSYYGHDARVWKIAYLNELIVTASEDMTICVWKDGKEKPLAKEKCHEGRSCWALDAYGDKIFTGGADGYIKRHDVNCILKVSSNEASELFENQRVTSVLILRNFKYKGWYLGLLSNSSKIVIQKDDGKVSETDFSVLGLGNISCIAENTDSASIYLAFTSGVIVSHDLTTSNSSVFYKIDSDDQKPPKIHNMTYSQECELLWLSYQGNVFGFLFSDGTFVRYENLASAKTTAWHLAVCETEHLILVGDRNGTLHAFDTFGQKVSIYSNAHGKNGLTSIIDHPELANKALTSGSDDTIKLWQVDIDIQLLRTFSNFDHFSNIQRMQIFKDNTLLLHGFSANQYNQCLYNLDSGDQSVVMSVNCGGMHRCWDANENDFVYIIKGHAKKARGNIPTITQSIICGFATGRHVNQAVFTADGDVFYGGEDTRVRVAKLENKKLVHSKVFSEHISSVFSVAVCEKTGRMFSGGGRNQLFMYEGDLVTDLSNCVESGRDDSDSKIINIAVCLDKSDVIVIILSTGTVVWIDAMEEKKLWEKTVSYVPLSLCNTTGCFEYKYNKVIDRTIKNDSIFRFLKI